MRIFEADNRRAQWKITPDENFSRTMLMGSDDFGPWLECGIIPDGLREVTQEERDFEEITAWIDFYDKVGRLVKEHAR